jgi:pseudouridine kinase
MCVGAAHWDLVARAAVALTPGADVPGDIRCHAGGVAANVARFLASLGTPAALLAAVGDDADGAALVEELMGLGVDCAPIRRHAGQTDLYLAIETDRGVLHAAVADCRSLEREGPALVADLIALRPSCAVIDGNLPEPALAALSALKGTELAILAASPEKAARLRGLPLGPATRFYGNRAEAEALCGTAFAGTATAASALVALGFGSAVVSDGPAPAASAGARGSATRLPPRVAVQSVTGAGDMLAAAHLTALARGMGTRDALDFALAAATRHISGDIP